MKLYHVPGYCSLAPHIILRELNASFDLDKVDLESRTTASGENYLEVNSLGYVPALREGNGEVLTEGVAILQYLADKNPSANLAPAAGTIERARMQQHLNYISSELHKAYSPFFATPPIQGEAKEAALKKLATRLGHINDIFSDGRSFLLGDDFTVADAYLFVVTNWSGLIGVDLNQWPHIEAFAKRVSERESVQEALRAEGLLQ